MTTLCSNRPGTVVAAEGVYAPQADSWLLIEALERSGLATGRCVLDMCTGSGVVAIAAAELGASSVTAFDICPLAVHCARDNAESVELQVEARVGTLAHALDAGPFELVLCNPPYVPVDPGEKYDGISRLVGPAAAWNAGRDGRDFLDPLCDWASELLVDGGAMLLVQSEFSGVERSLTSLRSVGLDADVVAVQPIPFGPVLAARAAWLERVGRLNPDCREEKLVVIRADKQ